MTPSITLLSDLGLQDASVAVAKGILIQHGLYNILDISHEIAPFNVTEAAYVLGTSFGYFAPGSVHIVPFGIFNYSGAQLMLAAAMGHYFILPESGLIEAAIKNDDIDYWYDPKGEKAANLVGWMHNAAKLCKAIVTDGQVPNNLLKQSVGRNFNFDVVQTQNVVCDVVHVDQYENVIINYTLEQYNRVERKNGFRLTFSIDEEISEISTRYSDVEEGMKLCKFNSSGYLKICINRGKASSLFGLKTGSKHNNIKITFNDSPLGKNDLFS
jgi:S-adenosylmethionine hydrolase